MERENGVKKLDSFKIVVKAFEFHKINFVRFQKRLSFDQQRHPLFII